MQMKKLEVHTEVRVSKDPSCCMIGCVLDEPVCNSRAWAAQFRHVHLYGMWCDRSRP